MLAIMKRLSCCRRRMMKKVNGPLQTQRRRKKNVAQCPTKCNAISITKCFERHQHHQVLRQVSSASSSSSMSAGARKQKQSQDKVSLGQLQKQRRRKQNVSMIKMTHLQYYLRRHLRQCRQEQGNRKIPNKMYLWLHRK